MRKLSKTTEPSVLVANRVAWTKEFIDYVSKNGGLLTGAPARYRHKRIRRSLRVELHDKCAYCESKISHVTFAHIEHIVPKARRPDLVVSWLNLTLACPICNQHKADYFDPDAPLLHPYEDNPELSIEFIGPMARADGYDAGYRTIQRCQLNRPELVLRRLTVLEQVEQLVRQAAGLADPSARAFVLREVRAMAHDGSEYTSMLHSYIARFLTDEAIKE